MTNLINLIHVSFQGFVHEWLRGNMPSFVNLAIAMHFMSVARASYFRKLKKKNVQNNSGTWGAVLLYEIYKFN